MSPLPPSAAAPISDPRSAFRLDSRVVVVTGGTRGLGLATADALLSAGASVLVAYRAPDSVEKTVAVLAEAGRPVAGTACDLNAYWPQPPLARCDNPFEDQERSIGVTTSEKTTPEHQRA